MPLPWVRLDSNIATHDKVISLVQERNGYRAAFVYVCALGYCGGHGTDGLVKYGALPFIHATRPIAELLVKHGLWAPHPEGWYVPHWAERQELEAITEGKRAAQRAGAAKANCRRWHGPECGCWKEGLASA